MAPIDCDIRWIDYFVKYHGSLEEKDNVIQFIILLIVYSEFLLCLFSMVSRTVLHFICKYGNIPVLDHVLQQVLTSTPLSTNAVINNMH